MATVTPVLKLTHIVADISALRNELSAIAADQGKDLTGLMLPAGQLIVDTLLAIGLPDYMILAAVGEEIFTAATGEVLVRD